MERPRRTWRGRRVCRDDDTIHRLRRWASGRRRRRATSLPFDPSIIAEFRWSSERERRPRSTRSTRHSTCKAWRREDLAKVALPLAQQPRLQVQGFLIACLKPQRPLYVVERSAPVALGPSYERRI